LKFEEIKIKKDYYKLHNSIPSGCLLSKARSHKAHSLGFFLRNNMFKNKVYIVGGGSSLKNFDFNSLKSEDTIVTNASIFDVPNPMCFITVDFSFINKIQNRMKEFNKIDCKKVFVADFSKGSLIESNGRIRDHIFGIDYILDPFDQVIKAKRSDGFGFTFTDFRTGLNSGYCALQMAILMGYKEIHLLGFDLICGDSTHYHDRYPCNIRFKRQLQCFYNNFEAGLNQLKVERPEIKIYSRSSISRLNKIIPFKILSTTKMGTGLP